MFVDMRGSTKLSEERLPFDIVFLINRFVDAASQAVTDAGGQPNQFVGDGVLALFGLDVDRRPPAGRLCVPPRSLRQTSLISITSSRPKCAIRSNTASAFTPAK